MDQLSCNERLEVGEHLLRVFGGPDFFVVLGDRAVGPDDRVIKGVALALLDATGAEVRAKVRPDGDVVVFEHLFPRRLKIVVRRAPDGLTAAAEWIELKAGAVLAKTLRFGP